MLRSDFTLIPHTDTETTENTENKAMQQGRH